MKLLSDAEMGIAPAEPNQPAPQPRLLSDADMGISGANDWIPVSQTGARQGDSHPNDWRPPNIYDQFDPPPQPARQSNIFDQFDPPQQGHTNAFWASDPIVSGSPHGGAQAGKPAFWANDPVVTAAPPPGPLTRAVASVPTNAKDQPKEKRSAIGDFLKSIPGGILGGLSGEASALGQAAQIESSQPVDVPDAATTKQAIEQNVTGQLPEPQGAAGQYGQRIGEVLGSPSTYVGPGGLGAKVLGGAISAVGSEAAGQATEGTPYEGAARVAGGIIAPVGLGTVAKVGGSLVRAGVGIGRDAIQPLTASGQEQIAANRLRSAASDPDAVAASVENGPQVLVPGSVATTYQQTGDAGLGQLQRQVETQNAAPFIQRAQEQAVARDAALGNVQQAGSPEQLAAAVKARLTSLQSAADQVAQKGAQDAQDAATGLGQGIGPEAAGSDLRSSLAKARAAAKDAEDALWTAVDPDKSLALPATNTVEASQAIKANMTPSAIPLTPEEQQIHAAIDGYGNKVSLQELRDLQQNVTTSMRALRGNNAPAYARLGSLNSAINSDLADAVARKMAEEQAAVNAGQGLPDEAQATNTVNGWVDDWRQRQQAQDQARGTVSTGLGAGNTGGQSASAVRAGLGSQSASGAKLPNDADYPGLSQNAGGSFDQDALGRLKAATGATKQRVITYDNKTLGPMLARPSTEHPFNVPDYEVAANVFAPGPKGAANIATYRKAVGDPAAMDTLQGYAVDRLRQMALKPDGTFDPAKIATFRKQYGEALKAFPALDAKFANAATVTEAAAEKAAQAKQKIDDAQKGIVGKVMGLDHGQDITSNVGRALESNTGVQQMTRLRSAVSNSPDGQEGLRKSVADYMVQKLKSTMEAGASGVKQIKAGEYQKFVAKNVPALRAAGFSDEQINAIQTIGEDLMRSSRSGALPARSTTAQDATLLRKFLGAAWAHKPEIVGGVIGHVIPVVGAPAGFAVGHLYGSMREAGLKKVDEILTDAMLNPDRAKLLLSKATTPTQTASLTKKLGDLYRRSAIQWGVQIAPRRVSNAQGADHGIGPAVVSQDQNRNRRYLDLYTGRPVPQAQIDALRAALAAKARQLAPGVGAMR